MYASFLKIRKPCSHTFYAPARVDFKTIGDVELDFLCRLNTQVLNAFQMLFIAVWLVRVGRLRFPARPQPNGPRRRSSAASRTPSFF